MTDGLKGKFGKEIDGSTITNSSTKSGTKLTLSRETKEQEESQDYDERS